MSDSLLKTLKIVVALGAVLIVVGTATLIWALVKRGTSLASTPAPVPGQAPATVAMPIGSEITGFTVAGDELLLLGRSPWDGQFVLVVDRVTGERRRLLRLEPAPP